LNKPTGDPSPLPGSSLKVGCQPRSFTLVLERSNFVVCFAALVVRASLKSVLNKQPPYHPKQNPATLNEKRFERYLLDTLSAYADMNQTMQSAESETIAMMTFK